MSRSEIGSVSAPPRAAEGGFPRLQQPSPIPQPSRRRHLDRLIPHGAPLVTVLAIAAILLALSYAMNHSTYLVWGAFWVAPVLFVLSLPIARRAAHRDGETIGRIVLVAAILKILVAPAGRYWMIYGLYGGVGDANGYHDAGTLLAPLFRQGIYRDLGEISGTRFMEVLTGQIYALTGPTRLGGFMVFSWFSFLGLYLFYRAFRTAFPDGDGRRYALLVFFFPTVLFWPSSIGKEAFMLLTLGAAALGAAQLFNSRMRGLIWLTLGLWGAAVVRPHVALIVAAGLVVAAPIAVLGGGAQRGGRKRGRLGGAVLLLALLLSASTLIAVAQDFLGLESLTTQTAQAQFEDVTRRSGEKGSTFTGYSPNNPVGFALSGITVLFRPFPLEVRNVQGLISSMECLVLLALGFLGLRRLARLPREVLRRPYAAFALVYTFAFIYAFSSIVNFGILARQRAQLLPLVFVLLCIPLAPRQPKQERDVTAGGSPAVRKVPVGAARRGPFRTPGPVQ